MMRMNISVRLLSTKHVKHVLARAIICSMFLILPSCGIPNLRLPEAAPDLPPTFNGVTTPDNSAQLGIEEYYNDPILSSVIDQALMGNRELRILDEEVQIARAEVVARTGAYLPFFSMGLGAGWDRPSRFTRSGAVDSTLNIIPGHPFPSPLADVIGSVNVFWQI